jgi:hypothetical protein
MKVRTVRISGMESLRFIEVLEKRGVLKVSTGERVNIRLCRQYERIREDQDVNCEERVRGFGCRVKKGGKE